MKLLIHSGFHKTGTSWLQATIFAGNDIFVSLMDHDQIDQLFLRQHDFDFGPGAASDAIGAALSAAPSGKLPVISSEILTGNPFDGSRDSRMLAERLHASWPEARILLTVRKPAAFAKGMYLQYLKRGGRMKPEEFFSREPEPGYRWFTRECAQFGRVADHYAQLFGRENVLVLPQELLRTDREAYLSALVKYASGGKQENADFPLANQKVGESPPESGLFLMRMGNLFYKSTMNPEAIKPMILGRIMHKAAYSWSWGKDGARRKLDKVIVQYIPDEAYAASNAQLQQYCPVDLAELGYHLG